MNGGHDLMDWMQNWFHTKCDGSWEQGNGIDIQTLDNPGWAVTIDIQGTGLRPATFKPVIRKSPKDFLNCKVVDGQFKGYGSPQNLAEILGLFREWVEQG